MSSKVEIDDTFAEAFPMLACRILITAESEAWARTAAATATGFASSIIMSPAEAGMEGPTVAAEKSPDNRPGVNVQIYHRTGMELKMQMLGRIGQCVLTCPTTAAFDSMPHPQKRIKIGRAIRLFGDGFQKEDRLNDRKVWRIPVMEGEFTIEDRFGVRRAVAGGNLLIMGESQKDALTAAEKAIEAIRSIPGVVATFPGGICRSGSKVGSMKYKLGASTNHPYCPTLRGKVEQSHVPEGVASVYELVFNGLNLGMVKKATAAGIQAISQVPGIVKISAVNFGGKLGPYKIGLREAAQMTPH